MRYDGVIVLMLSFVIGLSVQASIVSAGPSAEATQIDREVDQALTTLFEITPEAEIFRKEAKGILMFPSIVKGGFMIGAHVLEGRPAKKRGHGRLLQYDGAILWASGRRAIVRLRHVLHEREVVGVPGRECGMGGRSRSQYRGHG